MVLDTSAVIAILFDEPDAERFEAAIADAPGPVISAASLLECSIVVEARYGEEGGRELDLLLFKAQIGVAAVTAEQVELARTAYRRFGRSRHRAGLNFGDCFSYALAASRGAPLLYKGEDFARTDVFSALG